MADPFGEGGGCFWGLKGGLPADSKSDHRNLLSMHYRKTPYTGLVKTLVKIPLECRKLIAYIQNFLRVQWAWDRTLDGLSVGLGRTLDGLSVGLGRTLDGLSYS